MKYIKELDDLFRKYEIENYPDFWKNAEHLEGICNERQLSKHALLLDDLYSDAHDIGYIYIVDKTGQNSEWELIHVCASYQLDTVRNETGVLVISKEYFRPIPAKPVIRNEILDMLAKEKTNELFFSKQRFLPDPDYNRRFQK